MKTGLQFQGTACREFHDLAGRNIHLRARKRIATRAGLALPDQKGAEAENLHRLTGLNPFGDSLQHRIHSLGRIRPAQPALQGRSINQFSFVHTFFRFNMLNYNCNALPQAAAVFRLYNSDIRDDDAHQPFETPETTPA